MSIIGFADFETKLNSLPSFLNSKNNCRMCLDEQCSHISYTRKVESHELISYSLVFIDIKSTLIYEKHYCGPKVEENSL